MATASTSDDVCEWQMTKNTVGERIQHMYRSPLMADVHFTVTDGQGSSSPKVNIPCHKFILAISSPIFYKMFYGELKEASDYIDLPDCDSEGLHEFLRFIYCDEVELTGSCVIQVLYLAKKYMIPSLANRCRSFLEANINAENVLDLLPVVEKMEESHLIDVCWKVIDTRTAKVLESAPDVILEDNNLLVSILKRDTLDVKEVEVFQAVNRWAEEICAKQGIKPSGEEKRAIIGDEVMKLIRFPSMPQSLFGEHVVDTKILTDTEIIEIFMYFSVTRIPRGFSCFPRCLNISNLLRCNRLEGCSNFLYLHPRCDTEFTESTSFSVNVPILLGGITIFGCRRGEENTVKIKLNDRIVSEGCFPNEDDRNQNVYGGFGIIFKQYHLMNPDIPCILEALIKGIRFTHGSQNKKELVVGKIRFRFAGPPFQSENICIKDILFRPLKNK